jgi:hypothetical protein
MRPPWMFQLAQRPPHTCRHTAPHLRQRAPGPRPAHGLETQERAGGHAVRRIQRPQTACRSPPEPGESARTRRRQEPPFCRRFSSAAVVSSSRRHIEQGVAGAGAELGWHSRVRRDIRHCCRSLWSPTACGAAAATARHEKAAHLSAGAPAAAVAPRRGVLLVAGSGGAAAAAAGLRGRPDIVHCVRGGPSRPPAGCGNVQDSDDDEARGQRGDRWGAAAAAAVKRIFMNDTGKFGSQSKIQSGSAFLT